ncbi:MAG TPA: MBOAT family protein, partial [Novosphingobium sp.]|nr:MBOAT family protein [Novosphingobium sp.]
MLFGSLVFVFAFLPVVLLAYHALRGAGHERTAKYFLVAASLFFYGWWDPRYVPLVSLSIGANFALSLLMERQPGRASLLLGLGVAGNLALLGYYKYAHFFVTALAGATGLPWHRGRIVLPLAISFFSFQQIAYLIESRRDGKAAHSLLDYALFVLFFPHLIAGPITHHKEMLPQFAAMGRHRLPPSYMPIGTAIFIMGLAKKVVVADLLAMLANPVFNAARDGLALAPWQAWQGALAYTLQLYFDFSGYSDMAIGLGLMFGILLPVNFASPYKSTSIVEFWRRWHISLSRFLRNYLYFSLGGNRAGPVRRYANLLATMLLGGLWHGAGWTFIAWGGLHGSYLVINHLWRGRFGPARGPVGRLAGWGLTMLAVVVAWVLFRADTFASAVAVLRAMAGAPLAGGASGYLVPQLLGWAAVALAGGVALFAPNVLEMAGFP